ncbi:MAG: GNAT superfamily N-acetyltransferase [Myxococcota bacterium]|jgi:GNAT superfamily N-acetyltransferase
MSGAELLGYVASVLVAISLTMSNVWKLRWVNLFGAMAFTIYGGLIGAIPILVVNGFITVVNVVYLWKMANSADAFEWLPVPDNDPLVERLLAFHDADVKRFFPEFDAQALRAREDDHWLLVLRNAIPVGLCVVTLRGEAADIDIDYVTPDFRDLKNGRFLYDRLTRRLAKRGVKTIRSRTAVKAHRGYLEKMGFVASPNEPATLERSTSAAQ